MPAEAVERFNIYEAKTPRSQLTSACRRDLAAGKLSGRSDLAERVRDMVFRGLPLPATTLFSVPGRPS
jgi:hypothetical protein